MNPTTSAPPDQTRELLPFRLVSDVTVADARLCAALGAMTAWMEAHGDRGSQDRDALWRGYRLSHELMMAFCAVDGAAFGGGR